MLLVVINLGCLIWHFFPSLIIRQNFPLNFYVSTDSCAVVLLDKKSNKDRAANKTTWQELATATLRPFLKQIIDTHGLIFNSYTKNFGMIVKIPKPEDTECFTITRFWLYLVLWAVSLCQLCVYFISILFLSFICYNLMQYLKYVQIPTHLKLVRCRLADSTKVLDLDSKN